MKTLNKFLMIPILCASIFAAGCSNDDDVYLVRETDSMNFPSPLASTQDISLRTNGVWTTNTPSGSEWISITPSGGSGAGEFQMITVAVTSNRGAERTGKIYLSCGKRDYPITVTQAEGSMAFGTPYVEGNLIESEASSAKVCFTYENAFGDETISVSCVLGGDSAGLTVTTTPIELNQGSGTVAVDITGTPTAYGTATFAVSVDGTAIGTAQSKVYSMSEMPVEGFPVKWEFSKVQGTTEDRDKLAAAQPNWITDQHYLVSDTGSSYITLVEADGKSGNVTLGLNGWGYNDGHAYIKGIYNNDYWQLAIPVKYVTSGTKINCTGSIGGSGSAAGFFLIEYSADGTTWTQAAGAATETFNDVEVTYHIRARDSMLAEGENVGHFSYNFPMNVDIASGTLYIRYRVSANVRITANNTITNGGGGSNRLKGTFSVSLLVD